MEELTILSPNHGYSNGDPVYVSWLDDVYYIVNATQRTFQLSETAGGDAIQSTGEVIDGFVRKVDIANGATTISGLDHLEGETVTVTSGGERIGSYKVTNGSITVPTDLYTYQVGLGYAMKIKTMRLELPNVQGLQSKIKRIHETVVRYLRSRGGQAGQEYGGTEYLSDLNATYSNQSQDATVLSKGGFSTDGYTVIKSVDPYPFTALATIVSFSVDEN